MSSIGKILKNRNTKAGSFYLIGNIFNKAIVFLTIPIFTRLMSTTDFGIVNTYMSWVSILSLIVGLSLGSSIRSAYMDFKDSLEEYISSILFLSLINFVISSTLIITFSYLFIKQIDIFLILLCLIQSYMTFISNTISVKYMVKMDYVKNTFLLALPNTIVAILSVLFLINMDSHKYLGRIIPYVIVTSILGCYYLIRYFVKEKTFVNRIYWKYAVLLSIPLIFHGLSVNVLSVSDRTMITVFRSASETGIYSLVYNLSMIPLVVTTSMESIWIPWFNNKLQNGERNIINRNVKIYIEIIVIVMIGLLFIGPEILVVMAPKEYWSGKTLISPILLASFFIFLYSISVDLEYYYKSTKIIATNTIIAAFVNLGLNFIFIPKYGAIAAAYTTVIAYIVSFVIHYNAARKLDNQLFPFSVYVKPILIMVIAVFISYLIMNQVIMRWTMVIIGLGLYAVISYKKHRFTILLK